MTVETAASMDLTTLFKSCVKTIRTRNKAMGVSLPKTKIFPNSSQISQFYTRARDIHSNITSHRNLLRDHQRKYLIDHEGSMTDIERSYMEKVVTTNLRIIDDNIKTLRIEVEGDQQGSSDACECRKNILSTLEINFQQVNSHFKDLMSKRKKKLKDKETLMKLHRPGGLKKRQSTTTEESSKSTALGHTRTKSNSSQDTCDGSQPDSWGPCSLESAGNTETAGENKQGDSPVVTQNNVMPSPVEEEIDNMLGSLSSEERQILEEENLHLYKELMSNQEEVRQITRQVVELGQMQDFFSEKVDIQAHQIEKIQETIMAATENVKEGNEQVREAMRKDAGFRVWIMFFLIVMSCTILFLDWYNG